MAKFKTVHSFEGQSVCIAVRRYCGDNRIGITLVAKNRGKKTGVILNCGGAVEAEEIRRFLRLAILMVRHLEEGGAVEVWNESE